MDAAFILNCAAFMAERYDRDAKGEVLLNLTDDFHLCGLIERAASSPKSGATHRKPWDSGVTLEAKAAFCRAHQVAHPSAWEWERRRDWSEVQQALTIAAGYG